MTETNYTPQPVNAVALVLSGRWSAVLPNGRSTHGAVIIDRQTGDVRDLVLRTDIDDLCDFAKDGVLMLTSTDPDTYVAYRRQDRWTVGTGSGTFRECEPPNWWTLRHGVKA